MKQKLARDATVALMLSFCSGSILDFVFGLIRWKYAVLAAQFISPLNPMWWFMVCTSVLATVGFRYWQLSKEQK